MSGVNENRLDASDLVIFRRQLEIIKKKEYNEKNRILQAVTLVPVDPEVRGEGIETVTYRTYSKTGVAAFFGDYGGSIPRVDVFGQEQSVKIYRYGSSYGYSIFEIKKAIRAGQNLKSKKADAVYRAIAELTDEIVWSGNARRGLRGLINYPGISEYAVPNGGTGFSEWSTKTPAEIYADMRAMVKTPYITTNGIEKIDTLLLPIEQYEYIKDIQFSSASDLTIMEYFKRNNPDVMVEAISRLAGAGDGGADRMLAYVRDEDHLTQEFPVLPKQEPEYQEDPFNYVVPVYAEHGGVIVYYPASVIFADGI